MDLIRKRGLVLKAAAFRIQITFRRWLVIQGLDLVRRAVLGKLASPAD